MKSEVPLQLDYQPQKNSKNYFRLIRRITSFVLVVGIVIVGGKKREDISRRFQLAYWGYRCAHHVTPPGTALVEDDPIKAAQLIASNPDYVMDGAQILPPPANVNVRQEQMQITLPWSAVYWPVEFRKLSALNRYPAQVGIGTEAISFLGERTSPAGNERLIAIPVWRGNRWSTMAELQLFSQIFTLPGWLGKTPIRRGPGGAYAFCGAYQPVTYSPATADPADASHILLPYSFVQNDDPKNLHTVTGTIDIYLHDNDTLDIRLPDAGKDSLH